MKNLNKYLKTLALIVGIQQKAKMELLTPFLMYTKLLFDQFKIARHPGFIEKGFQRSV